MPVGTVGLGVEAMRHAVARWAAVLFVMQFLSAGAAHAGVSPLNGAEAAASRAARIVEELEFFNARLAAVAEGTLRPLFHGRSMPLPAESCAIGHTPRIFGLLIGASDPGPRTMRLAGPDNDVRLLASTLETLGAAKEDIFPLVGDEAGREAIVEAAWTILSRLECNDKVFVHYGGTALVSKTVARDMIGDGRDSPRERSLDEVLSSAREMLGGRAEADLSALRSLTDATQWYLDSGITLFLNGSGEIVDGKPQAFEVLTGDDVAELVTLFRNHRADVTLVLDTCYASTADVLGRHIAVSDAFWSVDVGTGNVPGTAPDEADRKRSRLSRDAGELAVFYSSIDENPSIEASFDVDGEKVKYGLFTFRVAQALLENREATVRDISAGLNRIAAADAERRWRQAHRIEATNADMRVFAGSADGAQRTDTIRIISPSDTRGARVVEVPQLEIVGVVDWHAPARAVLVEGQPAALSRDGRFSARINLRAGVNTISVTGLTADNEIHLMPPLELVYDGDLKKFENEGRRFALIIANRTYLPETGFSSLQTPVADAEALQSVLAARYGFETELRFSQGESFPLFLVDATKDRIEDALYTLGQVAGENDTVLIYYAGHGVYDERTLNAAWVPVDATRPYNYLSGATITEHVQRLRARKVILISDSCYSGALRSGGEAAAALAQVTAEDRNRTLARMAQMKSRVLITSGGTEPVLDLGGGGHSVFARALLTGLEKIDRDIFSAEELFHEYIRPMVAGRADQVPQMRPMDRTEHEPGGDVVFVRAAPAGGATALQ